MANKTTALVLAGGGSRGAYHIGVWKALRELGVKFQIVTGTSVGALTGAIIAQGDYETAEEVFSGITDEDVMALPSDYHNLGMVRDFLTGLAKNKGVDVTPLETLLARCVNEKEIRASGIKYGLVTIKKSDFSPLEITLDEMPDGTLIDYMMASAAIFPGFMPRKIDGEEYVDGGSFNNLPIGLAEDMGADEVIAVDLEAIGIEREYKGGLPVRYIRPYWNLGNIVKFESKTARRNITLGYLDAMKAYKQLDGCAYTLKKGELARFARESGIGDACRPMLAGGSLAQRNAWTQLMRHTDVFRNDVRLVLGLMDFAAETFDLDYTQVYTADEINRDILDRCDEAPIMESLRDLKEISREAAAATIANAMYNDSLAGNKSLSLLCTTYPSEYAAACYISQLKRRRGY